MLGRFGQSEDKTRPAFDIVACGYRSAMSFDHRLYKSQSQPNALGAAFLSAAAGKTGKKLGQDIGCNAADHDP